MDLYKTNPMEEPLWDEWVLGHEAFQFFHSSSWIRVLHETYGYEPACLVCRGSEDRPGVFPLVEVDSLVTGKRGVCLPFSDDCAPLAASPEALKGFLEALGRLGRKRGWRHIEWRGRAGPGDQLPPWSDWLAHDLSLEASEERQWAKLRSSNRRNIRKAQKHGVEVVRLDDLAGVDVYYRLHCRTRRRLGLPPQPLRFFRKIHEHIVGPGKGFVLLARWQGRWIAGAVFFRFGGKALYKFGASDGAFLHLRPNNLLIWDAIRRFRESGYSSFSFGRTSPQHEGLLRFKRLWGAEERQIHYYRLELKRPHRRPPGTQGPGSLVVRGILRRMPLFALRLLGELTYRHLG